MSDLKYTETLDRLYLEWSQFTSARTAREIAMLAALQMLLDAHWPLTETDDHEDPACAAARLILRKVQGLTP